MKKAEFYTSAIILLNVCVFFTGVPIIVNFTMEIISLLLIFNVLYYLEKAKDISKNRVNFCTNLLFIILIYIIFGYTYALSKSNVLTFSLRFLVYFFQLKFIYSPSLLKKILRSILIVGSLLSFTIFIDFFFFSRNNPSGIFEDYQRSGEAMSILATISSTLFIFNLEKKDKKLNTFALIVSILALLIIGKRMFIILPLICLLITYFLKYRAHVNLKIISLIVLSIITVVLLYFMFPNISNTINAFIEKSGDSILTNREIFWNYAIDIFNDNKIFGIGFNSYPTYLQNLNSPLVPAWAAHNIYLQLLADTGLIGFTLFMMLFISTLIYSLKYVIKYRYTPLIYVGLSFQIWFLIYGISGNPLYLAEEFYFYIFGIICVFSCVNYYKKGVKYE